jgi:hypothetical protein
LFFFLPVLVFGQEKTVRFRVVSDSLGVAGANVVNLVNEKSAVSDGQGYFSLAVKEDDLLVISSMSHEYKRRSVFAADLKAPVVVIELTAKPNELDEVVVKQKEKPDDLIMHHKDHRDFTPAERKLYTARSGILDPLLNAISGRTSMLKKELQAEMNERLLARLDAQFGDDYYMETQKIPEDYVRGFKYYLIENGEFVQALKDKNKTMMRFLMGPLAVQYNKLIEAQPK